MRPETCRQFLKKRSQLAAQSGFGIVMKFSARHQEQPDIAGLRIRDVHQRARVFFQIQKMDLRPVTPDGHVLYERPPMGPPALVDLHQHILRGLDQSRPFNAVLCGPQMRAQGRATVGQHDMISGFFQDVWHGQSSGVEIAQSRRLCCKGRSTTNRIRRAQHLWQSARQHAMKATEKR